MVQAPTVPVEVVAAMRVKARHEAAALANVAWSSTPAAVEVAQAKASFRAFLPHWRFVSRETGEQLSFAELWPGQQQLADAADREPWLYGLKAGKLGFTELECAFDAYRALFSHARARVHLLSKDYPASRSLLDWVEYGIRHLPAAWGIRILSDLPGGDTVRSLFVRGGWMESEDYREIWSYAPTKDVAIDQSCVHAHVDELARIPGEMASPLFQAVLSTVSPTGTLHVITRGNGPDVYAAALWEQAKAGAQLPGGKRLYPFFVPYNARPDRTVEDRQALTTTMSAVGVAHYWPEDEEDAMMGDSASEYIPLDLWDALFDPGLPPLLPGDRTPLVLAVDAAVTGDCFAVVAASRHPLRPADAAIRAVKVWRPQDFPGGRIDFEVTENWLRFVTEGGCPVGHPKSRKGVDCAVCLSGPTVDPYNVLQICFDQYQFEATYQSMRKDREVWLSAFDQGGERLLADSLLYGLAHRGQLSHNGDSTLREHIGNARAKTQPDQDSTMRIVKRVPTGKVDAAVAAAMAVHRIMSFNL